MTDTPTEARVGEKAAQQLHAHEKALMPVVGEICPIGTMDKLNKMKKLLQELRLLVALV